MPAKNRIKEYRVNGYYHLYNRGVEKRVIFTDKQDYEVFLSYLKEYLSIKNDNSLKNIISDANSTYKEKTEALRLLRMNNFSNCLDLLAYCLMPNHFHFLIYQSEARAIEVFMRSLGTRYVQYFNKKHGNRVGSLFQDTYKAVLVESEEQLWHLSRYIHRNPRSLATKGLSLKDCPIPSSYPNYLYQVKQEWIKPEIILNYFSKSENCTYKSFVENSSIEEESLSRISSLLMDI